MTDIPGHVPFAYLSRLGLPKLELSDVDELQRLWEACTTSGFFYLDLAGSEACSKTDSTVSGDNGNWTNRVFGPGKSVIDETGSSLLEDANGLFELAEKISMLTPEQKAHFDSAKLGSYFGFKARGHGVIDEHTRDRVEFYNYPKDDLVGLSVPLPMPAVVAEHKALMKSFAEGAEAIVMMLLQRLDRLLGLRGATPTASCLSALHRAEKPSMGHIRFTHVPPQTEGDERALFGHTDFGSITLLFNRLGGLQVAPHPDRLPGMDRQGLNKDQWLRVKPLPGHCIVNLGDALVRFSGGILKSPSHRVVSPRGDQSQLHRYSVVYFSRPEDDAVLRPLTGQGSKLIDDAVAQDSSDQWQENSMTAKQWIMSKAMANRRNSK